MAKKKEIDINEAAKHLFEVLDKDMELSITPKGDLTYKGSVLSPSMKNSIIEQAKLFRTLETWQIVVNDMKQVACKKMYEESQDAEMIKFGKAILFTLDVLQKKLYNLSNIPKVKMPNEEKE